MSNSELVGGSFRDPSGFLFTHAGVLYRQVNESYRPHYEALISSGLYGELSRSGDIISHDEVSPPYQNGNTPYKTLKPAVVPFISYPQEWSFSQLKDAALLTLSLCEKALEKGMILKDASAYNIQFVGAKPVLIDTLSFEVYPEGEPWIAYRQFCQHFLAPLALMSYKDVSLGKLSQVFIDGVPLDIASKLLPMSTRLNLQLMLHIHMHAKSQKRYSDKALTGKQAARKLSKSSLLGLLDGLKSAVSNLHWRPEGTEWGDYYEDTNYTSSAMEQKRALVKSYIAEKSPRTVWDLGANTGVFSEVAEKEGAYTVSFDIDPAAVEKHYRLLKKASGSKRVPLLLDLTNPTPGYGWACEERMSIRSRGPADCAMALALIHHIAISNNVPFEKIARFFASICRSLIIEFVPKNDSQVQRLLASRPDIFAEYTQSDFERVFAKYFSIDRATRIEGSERTLYLMTAR